MKPCLLVHYSEIGTKGRNRRHFEQQLVESIKRHVSAEDREKVSIECARVVVRLSPKADETRIRTAMERVFGAAWYAFSREVSWDWQDIRLNALSLLDQHPSEPATFKVEARRSEKIFPLTSEGIGRKLGAEILAEKPQWKVQLNRPDLTVFVDVLRHSVHLFINKIEGLRGLPSRSSGRALCLFSGGIDSPVAAWLLMRRGVRVDFLHFHPFPSAKEVATSKITELFHVLRQYDSFTRLFALPHYPFKMRVGLASAADVEMVLFRRYIFTTARHMAKERGYKALITGDNLGQVASQTLENLACSQSGIDIPVLAPLIAATKDDITRTAKQIGTYEGSIAPYTDCCSLMAKHPRTKARLSEIESLSRRFEIDAVAQESLKFLELWNGKEFETAPPPKPPGRYKDKK